MKITKQNLNEILAGVLPLLADKTEQTMTKKSYQGSSLINFMNILTDARGKPIIASKTYTIPVKVEVEVNHERRIKRIIEEAKTMKELADRVGDYLAANAKSRKEVVSNIKSRKK